MGGTEEIYVPSTNTIYVSSIWGPYLHPGRRPGTFIYRNGDGAPAYTTHPLLVTARQRRLLLTGQDCIRLTSKTVGSKVKILGLKVLPPLRGPAESAVTLQQELANGNLHLAGRTTVNGRDAIELAAKTTDGTAPEGHLYFDPTTHLPFEEVDRAGTPRQQVIYLRLRKLPIPPATERLLSLQALYSHGANRSQHPGLPASRPRTSGVHTVSRPKRLTAADPPSPAPAPATSPSARCNVHPGDDITRI